jgi:hypothetical protein
VQLYGRYGSTGRYVIRWRKGGHLIDRDSLSLTGGESVRSSASGASTAQARGQLCSAHAGALYAAKVLRGDVACRRARQVLDQFGRNMSGGECDDPPKCTSASPGRWTCTVRYRDGDPLRPGTRIYVCRRSGDKIAFVYTGR